MAVEGLRNAVLFYVDVCYETTFRAQNSQKQIVVLLFYSRFFLCPK